MADTVAINRAPVLTLWAMVVAERLGYDRDAALTLGKCLAGLNAQAKGRRLGIYASPKGVERGGVPKKVGLGEDFWIQLCGRPLPAKNTADGIRAVIKDAPIKPAQVAKYLGQKFGDDVERVREAMADLAEAFDPDDLNDRAYGLYEAFRPKIPPGVRGWGAKGELDLDLIRSLAD